MEGAKLPVGDSPDSPRTVDWGAVSSTVLGFLPIAYLGLEGGGFDALVHDQAGIVAWWVLLATVAVGALPRLRLSRIAWIGLGLLAAFAVWTALSLGWTESVDRTWADLARVAGYLGVFALALFARGKGEATRIVQGVAAGIVFVSAVALLSRLHPESFDSARETAGLVPGTRERLSYPLEYWNGVGALIAIGIPVALGVATWARSTAVRGLFAAALPMLMLTLFFTLSRGAMAATAIALAVFIGLSPDRLRRVATLLSAGLGAAILIAAAASRHSLQKGLFDSSAIHQGNEILVLTVIVCVAVGLAQIPLGRLDLEAPAWARPTPRHAIGATVAVLVAVTAILVTLGAPGKLSQEWSDFKHTGKGYVKGVDRLGSLSGESRYQLWSSAVRQFESEPLHGTGSGTYEYWWARDGDTRGVIRDTHSLYLQTLGELGAVGLVLLLSFLAVVLVAGAFGALASPRDGAVLAAALAGSLSFWITAAFDWVWQIPVIPIAMLLLASALLPTRDDAEASPGLPWLPRAGFALFALAAILSISIPLTSTSLIRDSQAAADDGNATAAIEDARAAQDVQPSAATPRLQEALVLEEEGELEAAAEAARAATERESTNWRTWLTLSRIESKRGRASAAIDAYREARSLNPRSALFGG